MNTAALSNLALILLFGLQHSIMARDWFKKRFRSAHPRRRYALASLAALAILWRFWQPMPAIAWQFQGWIAGGLYLVWTLGLQITLFAALAINWRELIGLREPGPPVFQTPFLYTIVRHPIYLGTILMLWAAPRMTMGRLLFATGMTLYILIGMHFEEKDLERTFGEIYREYQRRVPMLIPGWPR